MANMGKSLVKSLFPSSFLGEKTASTFRFLVFSIFARHDMSIFIDRAGFDGNQIGQMKEGSERRLDLANFSKRHWT